MQSMIIIRNFVVCGQRIEKNWIEKGSEYKKIRFSIIRVPYLYHRLQSKKDNQEKKKEYSMKFQYLMFGVIASSYLFHGVACEPTLQPSSQASVQVAPKTETIATGTGGTIATGSSIAKILENAPRDSQGNVVIDETNKVNGYDNAVIGKYNGVNGNQNGVFGVQNSVQGHQNSVNGSNNVIRGVGNVVYSGDDRNVESSQPQQAYPSDYYSLGNSYRSLGQSQSQSQNSWGPSGQDFFSSSPGFSNFDSGFFGSPSYGSYDSPNYNLGTNSYGNPFFSNFNGDYPRDSQGNVVIDQTNKVNGYDNSVIGKYNGVNGNQNGVYGVQNSVYGNQNSINGNNNVIRGGGNYVYSDSNDQRIDQGYLPSNGANPSSSTSSSSKNYQYTPTKISTPSYTNSITPNRGNVGIGNKANGTSNSVNASTVSTQRTSPITYSTSTNKISSSQPVYSTRPTTGGSNGNVIIGNGNRVNGNQNFVDGNTNNLRGSDSTLVGSGLQVQGNSQIIIKDKNTVSPSQPKTTVVTIVTSDPAGAINGLLNQSARMIINENQGSSLH